LITTRIRIPSVTTIEKITVLESISMTCTSLNGTRFQNEVFAIQWEEPGQEQGISIRYATNRKSPIPVRLAP
jgi:hypothetical protein